MAIRDGDYSLVADPDYELSSHNRLQESWIPKIKAGGYTNYQLYDLSTDPGQTKNLAVERPELVEALKAKLLKINQSVMSEGVDWHLKSVHPL